VQNITLLFDVGGALYCILLIGNVGARLIFPASGQRLIGDNCQSREVHVRFTAISSSGIFLVMFIVLYGIESIMLLYLTRSFKLEFCQENFKKYLHASRLFTKIGILYKNILNNFKLR
jgi:hypothetical protein